MPKEDGTRDDGPYRTVTPASELEKLRAEVVSLGEESARQKKAMHHGALLLQAAREERDEALIRLTAVRATADDLRVTLAEHDRLTGIAVTEFGAQVECFKREAKERDEALIRLTASFSSLKSENANAEALVAVVHDALWSDQHRGEDVGDMARRVKTDLAAIADENIALEEKLREALASTGRARYENTLERAEKAERELGNLLAVVHRDGGHYQGKVGTEQAVKAAHERWGRLIALADRTEVAERERDEARAALVMAENPKLLGDRLSMLCCISPKYRIAPSCEEASAYSIAIGASIAAMQSAITDAERERDEAIKRHHEALDRLDHQTEVLDNAHPGNRLSVSGLLREAAFERQQAVLADERMHAAFVARSRAESERDKALASLADVIAADEALLLECMIQAWGIGVGVGRHETSTGSYSGPPDQNEFRVIIRRVMAWIASKKKKNGHD